MTPLEIISVILILVAAVAGGYLPLRHRATPGVPTAFPNGETFTAGVFLALSLIIMLPAGAKLFRDALPGASFPWAGLVCIAAFIFLLAIEHAAAHARSHGNTEADATLTPPAIPIIMTVMIAVPSFLLGTALGLSQREAAVFILLAVLAHKGSAGFGLALNMARSRLTRVQSILLYTFFACATPAGILAGVDVGTALSGESLMLVKAVTLSLAAGVFLYMATVHDLAQAPLICHCNSVRRFVVLLTGLILTAGVRAILGLAHAS